MVDEYLECERQKCREAHQHMANSEPVGVRVGSSAEVVSQEDASCQYS